MFTVLFMELMAQWSSLCRLRFEGRTSLQWRLTHRSPTGSPRSPLRPCQSPAAVNLICATEGGPDPRGEGREEEDEQSEKHDSDALQDRRKSAGIIMTQ